jgi:hypothetical protein
MTISYSIDGFAALAAKKGDAEKAAILAGAADGLRDSIGYTIEPAESRFREGYMPLISEGLTPGEIEELLQRGRQLPLEEALALCSVAED